MEFSILSAETLATVKIAIEICNHPEIKKEILCPSGLEHDMNKSYYDYSSKIKWNEVLEKRSTLLLSNLGIAKQLQEKIIGVVLLAGVRMLTWAEHHEQILGTSRDYSVNFLNKSFFTQRGIIDNKRAAEQLMKDESLSVKQKYTLACIYCFTDDIPVLYKQMTIDERKEFCIPRFYQRLELVKFWSFYLMNEINEKRGDKDLDQYRLERAIVSGNKAAVEYCLDKTKPKRNAIIDAAVKAVDWKIRYEFNSNDDENSVFRNRRFKKNEDWVPSYYYVDILCFLLLRMREDQLAEFFNSEVGYKKDTFKNQIGSRVLEYFLNWPYQDYFMKTAKLMWEFLPEEDFAVLLLKIADNIDPRELTSFMYGEEMSFDYRELLNKFWCQSPERFKRYIFNNQKLKYSTKPIVGLLHKLLTLKKFIYEDSKNIKLVLDSATNKEKENLFSSTEWRKLWFVQMKEENWEILDRFVLHSFLNKEKADAYKKELSFTKEAKSVYIDFIKNSKWNAVETLIKWCSLHDEEINKLKKEIAYSEDGMRACVSRISLDKNLNYVEKFMRWSFSSFEEAKAFRKQLVFSTTGICARLVEADQLELVSEFIKFGISSEGEISELKTKVAYDYGGSVCERLISNREEEYIYDYWGREMGTREVFKGGKWEEVEKFLTWCFSSEEEIRDFKRNELFEYSKEIHFNLITCNQWEQAEIFFGWLELSVDEIKELKKDTLFSHDGASEMFCELMYREEGYEEFVSYGTKQEAIELFLRWYLTDKETVLKFKEKFKNGIYDYYEDDEDEAVLKNFDLLINQRLKDLAEEQRGRKRKSEMSFSSKRFCNSKLKGAED